MEREVRYCTTEDGVRIAYRVHGDGPSLFIVPHFLESFSLDHLLPSQEDFFRRLGEGRQIIRYDPRGQGLSQREIDDDTVELRVRDIEAVVNAAGLDHFSIWASESGSVWGLTYAGQNPHRIDRVVSYAPYIRPTDAMPAESIKSFAGVFRTAFAAGVRTFADLAHRELYPESGNALYRIYTESATPENVARTFERACEPDWTSEPWLPKIAAPALVIHRRGDPIIPFQCGQAVAALLPDCRFLALDGQVHYFALEDADSILAPAVAFLDEDPNTRRSEAGTAREHAGVFRTILFTDLVGHTEMMSRLGDERGRAVLREHEEITRNVLKHHGGTEVKTMGDGFMASFGSVSKAVECTIALQRAFAERDGEPLSVRVGLNAGEPIEEDGDLFGATVILASRIAAKADGGEILVADTVRGLCSGKGFLFADRGDFVAKGFEEPVRVYEVSWRS